MADIFGVLTSIFGVLKTLDWDIILIIVAVAVVAMVIVSVFSGNSPWKWLGILGIVATAGIGIYLTQRGGVPRGVLKRVAERDKIIKQNNEAIRALHAKRAELEKKADADTTEINILRQEVAEKLEKARELDAKARAQDEEIKEILVRRQGRAPIRSSEEILARYGLFGVRPMLSEPVGDPSPPPAKPPAITVNGFVMKGDG